MRQPWTELFALYNLRQNQIPGTSLKMDSIKKAMKKLSCQDSSTQSQSSAKTMPRSKPPVSKKDWTNLHDEDNTATPPYNPAINADKAENQKSFFLDDSGESLPSSPESSTYIQVEDPTRKEDDPLARYHIRIYVQEPSTPPDYYVEGEYDPEFARKLTRELHDLQDRIELRRSEYGPVADEYAIDRTPAEVIKSIHEEMECSWYDEEIASQWL